MAKDFFRYRDLAFARVPGGHIVVAADSCAATGRKAADVLDVSPQHVGAVSARVVMLELMCVGAAIRVIADGVCSEMTPTGEGIIRGFHAEMAKAGLPPEILTGSTEDNFATAMTGVGTAGVGFLAGEFVPPVCHEGDVVCALGEPLVGEAVTQKRDAAIARYTDVMTLRADKRVSEMVPVGSHGVAWEIEGLAALHGLTARFVAAPPFDLAQSGGPSTCVLAVMSADAAADYRDAMPLTRVAVLKNS